MGQKFQYDESGSTFCYFLLSVLALILIPATLYYWPRRKKTDPAEESKRCKCPQCQQKYEILKKANPWQGPRNVIIKLLLLAGWAILAFLAYKVSQFDYELANFDPYEILGVSAGATQSQIRKAYHKLSLILHPDKDTGNEKEFMKLSKAYQALTDEESRYNWEKYGNPDGPGVMSFGIALPSWIVEKENSVWVLGLYALVFMVALPIIVGTWWYRSIKFTGDKVLLNTTQMYYYFFHRTQLIPLKRIIMILAASFEFDKRHNSEVIERHSDSEEMPCLIKKLPNLGEKNKERPLCYLYSIKARAIIHAHLSRMSLNPYTLEVDRRLIISKCPYLIQEQINTVNQLFLLAYGRRLNKVPRIETMENCMKLCALIVQSLWEYKSPLLQLPYITDDNLKCFMSKKRQIKTIQQFAQLGEDERRNTLRFLSDTQYENVMKVLSKMPLIDFQFKCEVIDDDNTTEVTVGAMLTVTVTLTRTNMSQIFGSESTKLSSSNHIDKVHHAVVKDCSDSATDAAGDTNANEGSENGAQNAAHLSNKRPAWMKQKRGGGGNKSKSKPKTFSKRPNNKLSVEEQPQQQQQQPSTPQQTKLRKKTSNSSDRSDSESNEDDSEGEDQTVTNSNEETGDDETDGQSCEDNRKSLPTYAEDFDDDKEWEKFQKIHEKEKSLEGHSKVSHDVHCPYFPEQKQEYWWTYICDRKSHTLLTVPYHVTNLIDKETVHLKFTAPLWPGMYTFTVCLRSDSYIGFDQQKDIKLEVKNAPEQVTDHPQWEFGDSEEDKPVANVNHDSEYTTDEDLPNDDD